jgi:peptidoglycan/LPS O-acetylase OafA/YrhL
MVALTFIASPLTGISIYAPLPLVNLTLTQAYFSDLVYSLLIPAWSMTVEAAFYLLLPLMLLSLRAVERLWAQAGVLALWAGGLLAGGVGAVALSKAAGWNTFYGFMGNADVMLVHTIFGRGIDLCIGVLLGLFVRRHGEALWRVHFARQNALLLALSSAGGVVALQVAMNAAGGGLGPAWYFNPLTALCWALLLLALTCPASPPARLFGAAPLVALGHISYALYLLQGTPVSIALFQLWGSPPVHYVVISLLSAGCTLAIERPARAWLVRKLSIARRGAPPV